MSRHGSRKPCFPIYPESLDGHIACQLTPGGQRQHFLIGTTLRQIYIQQSKFLSEYYNPRQIQVFSTPVNRTNLSAQAQLMGLYPQTNYRLNQKQKKMGMPPLKSLTQTGLQFQSPSPSNSQAIPIFVDANEEKNYMLDVMPVCPYALKYVSFTKTPPNFLREFKQKGEMGPFDILVKKFNLTLEEITPQVAWNYIDDISMTVQQFPEVNKYSLSSGQMNTLMHFFKFLFFEGKFKDKKQNALLNTNIFKNLINNFLNTIENDKKIADLERLCYFSSRYCDQARLEQENRLKFTFFSEHDSNLISMLNFLEYFQPPESPSGAATFFFRLFSKDDDLSMAQEERDYFIEIEYDGYVVRTLNFDQFRSDIQNKMYKGSIEVGCQVHNDLDENELIAQGTKMLEDINNAAEKNQGQNQLVDFIVLLLTSLLVVSVMYWWIHRKNYIEDEDEDDNGYILLDNEII